MFNIYIADLNICIENKYPLIEQMCQGYITKSKEYDFKVSVTDAEIRREDDGKGFHVSYLEILAVYRKIAEKIIEYKGFLMHGVVIETERQGIMFAAKSGTGKTTHALLWQKLLGDKMVFVNGDKPLIRIIGDEVYAYGTPWAGKENLHANMRTHLKTICFIERSDTNECIKLDRESIFKRLYVHLYKPENKPKLMEMFDMLDTFINKIDFYLIKCNKDLSAAENSYNTIFK